MSGPQEIGPETLLKAYAYGIFPMAEDRTDPALYWMDPDRRGIMPLDGFYVPKRLARTVRQGRFTIRVDHDFPAVIAACAEPFEGRQKTWINDRILALYSGLHRMGHAHSVEAYDGESLVGGLYGVSLGAAFFGESMFSRATDASKVALVHLVARLRAGGFALLDAQYITDHLAQFGAIEIPRNEYRRRLRRAVARPANFYGMARDASGIEVMQSLSQMS